MCVIITTLIILENNSIPSEWALRRADLAGVLGEGPVEESEEPQHQHLRLSAMASALVRLCN